MWRRPTPPLASEEELFAWIVAGADRARAGAPTGRLRLFSDGKPVRPLTGDLLPVLGDGDLGGWLDRVEKSWRDAALVVNGAQALDGELWGRILGFAGAHLSPSSGGASLEAFVGRYRRGPFGVHKDDQDVLTFVVGGTKRFLVWPFDVLAGRFGVDESARLAVRVLEGTTADDLPDDLRESATVLEGDAGDVLYWPASYWHVAVSAADEVRHPPVTATLALGIFPTIDPMAILSSVVASCRAKGVAPPSLGLPLGGDITESGFAMWDQLLEWLGSPAVRERALERLLSWTSAFRFPLAPPLAPPPPGDLVGVTPVARGTVAWARVGDELMWAAGGHVLRYPWHPGLARLFGRLEAGLALTLTEAVGILMAPGERPISPEIARHVIGLVVARNAARTA